MAREAYQWLLAMVTRGQIGFWKLHIIHLFCKRNTEEKIVLLLHLQCWLLEPPAMNWKISGVLFPELWYKLYLMLG